MADVKLLIGNNPAEAKLQLPIALEGTEWETSRKSAGRLTFKVIKDAGLSFQEGSPVRLSVDGKDLFFGFVFQKERNREQLISVTAYDQLRYFKNKTSIVYRNKTASELIKMLAEDFRLQTGEIEETGFKIASGVESNCEIFDIIQSALDKTLMNKKEMYVLYDDFGRLTLRNIANMKVGDGGSYLMIDEESGENFEYSSSIDSQTYNRIRLRSEDSKSGKVSEYEAKDESTIASWGVLQYFDTLKEGENGQAKAEALLSLYNKKTRKLRIRNAFGDVRVRAGSMLIVKLALGDINVQNFMLAESCTHRFNNGEHRMDLTLRGGDFVG